MPDASGKVAFITGASRGIGRSIARMFAHEGIKVICAARTAEPLQEVVDEIEASGGDALAVPLDVSSLDHVIQGIKRGVDHYGTIHILVNNAAVLRDKLILRMSEEDWDEVMAINLKGYFNGIKAVAPHMIKNRYGRILNLTSVVAMTGNAGQANYAASKAGVIGLTKSVARELASRNVTVNAIAPGYIDTVLTRGLSDKARRALISQIPMERIGEPDDVAHLALFLVSEGAGYITGQTLSVNGGLYM
ncbi:MAG: 3-oxoacyl-[acyl-carrier-protein] reductase [Fidelibacterota bacterium]